MATGISGYFDLTGSTSTFTVRVSYSETYDAAANTSTLSITSVQVKSSSPSGYYGYTYYPDGVIKINGVTVLTMTSTTPTGSVRVSAQDAWYTISNTSCSLADIAHNTDGSKSITVEVTGNRYSNFRFYTTDGSGGNGWNVSGSKTITLTTIPRASTIGATDANIGATSMIAVTKKASAYTHSIAYKFGSLSGYITESGGVSASEVKFSGTSVSFVVPTDFYAQIPNAKTGTCTLTCKTYSGSTQIGDAQTCTFTATAAEANCKPTVSGTVVDSNDTTKALTGDETKLIRYYSTALCTITATAKNSATISSKAIGGTAVSGTTRSIANVESGSVAFAAKDSRGYSASATVNATLIAYVKLTNNAVGARTDPTSGNATLTMKGNYYNGSFGAVSNTLTVKWRLSGGTYTTVTPTFSGNTYSASVDLSDLDYTQAYTYEVMATDKLASVTKTVTIGQGIPVFDWGQNDMNINVPLKVEGYPVAVRTYTASGWIMNALNGTVKGIGTATVYILPGGVAKIDFMAKITAAGTVTDMFDWGLNRNLLQGLNANIPTITPVTGGTLVMLSADGTFSANLNGYGGLLTARSQFWAPSRIYTYADTSPYAGSAGIWPESAFAAGCILRGSCFGTVTA